MIKVWEVLVVLRAVVGYHCLTYTCPYKENENVNENNVLIKHQMNSIIMTRTLNIKKLEI